jgi:hypothetical protein
MTKINVEDFYLQNSITPNEISNSYFTSQTDSEFLDENNFPRCSKDGEKVLAKIIYNKKSKHIVDGIIHPGYYLKILPNKNLIDSRKLYAVTEQRSSYVDSICKSDQQFLEVSKDTFQKYINFLKSENIQWLNMAQKDIQ